MRPGIRGNHFEPSLWLWMRGFHPCSTWELKEAGLQSHSRHTRWVPHIDYATLCIWSICHNTALLPRRGIQSRTAVGSTECCWRSDLVWALLQRCHVGTQTHTQREGIRNLAPKWRWNFWTANGGAIRRQITSEANEIVTTNGWPRDVTWGCTAATGRR